jgi:hypothetical protein
MKIGDLVELTFLDHGTVDDTNISHPSKHTPLICKVRGPVLNLGKINGHGYAEIVIWEAPEENSKTALVLLDVVIGEKVLK